MIGWMETVAPPGPLPALRPWQRLSVRLAALFALATLVAVGVVGAVIYERQKRELEDTVGTQLLNIARVGMLMIDPALHAEVQAGRGVTDSDAYRKISKALAAIQQEVVLATPLHTLADYDRAKREARIVVTSGEPRLAGTRYPIAPAVAEPLAWSFEDGVARYTRLYRNDSGAWITAVAPIVDSTGKAMSVLNVDYPVDVFLDRLNELRSTVIEASLAGALGASILGLILARRLSRPVVSLTGAAGRVAAGDLTQSVAVRSSDEIGRLTRAFNEMVEGLRQRERIRNAFGRYVSPEVAQTLLASPDGLRLGGEKRDVTILMSDLRGYTRFAEQGQPDEVMAILNDYLGRMADIVIAHGGTINEFIGDAIFAVFGAPIAHPDHAERAAATALAMQRALSEINVGHVARGLPRFEMGIGVNTGEAVVGNIGSEQRTKYAVVGSAVNLAGRLEGATVGGQVFISAGTYERIRDLAEVTGPVELQMKGVAGAVAVYELRGIGGRFAQRLSASDEEDRQVDIAIPVECSVLDGKVVSDVRIGGVTCRLGLTGLEATFAGAALAPLQNVRLTLSDPESGETSGDVYGKVVAARADGSVPIVTIRFTSVDARDRARLEALVHHRKAASGRS